MAGGMSGGVCGGHAWQEGVCMTGVCMAGVCMQKRRPLKQAVCILLKCILVLFVYSVKRSRFLNLNSVTAVMEKVDDMEHLFASA